MASRIYDETVLDNEANFTLHANIPSDMGIPMNADGSAPQVSLKVTGDSYRSALVVLSNLAAGDGELFLELALQSAYTNYSNGGNMDDLNDDEVQSVFDDVKFQELFTKFSGEWVDLKLEFAVEAADNEESVVTLHLRTPDYQTGTEAFNFLTSERMLNSLVAQLMPEIEDEDF